MEFCLKQGVSNNIADRAASSGAGDLHAQAAVGPGADACATGQQHTAGRQPSDRHPPHNSHHPRWPPLHQNVRA